MSRISLSLAVLLSLLLASCASMRSARDMRTDLQGAPLEFAPGRAELTGPVVLGIAPPLRTHVERWGHRSVQVEAWTDEEREIVDRWAKRFVEQDMIEEVVYLPRLLVSGSDNVGLVQSLRTAAQASGADVVMVAHSISSFEHSANLLSVLDLSIVGMFIFPSHTGSALTVSEGLVFDVASNQMVAFAEGQGESDETVALAYLDRDVISRKARLKSFEDLGAALLTEIERKSGAQESAPRSASAGRD